MGKLDELNEEFRDLISEKDYEGDEKNFENEDEKFSIFKNNDISDDNGLTEKKNNAAAKDEKYFPELIPKSISLSLSMYGETRKNLSDVVYGVEGVEGIYIDNRFGIEVEKLRKNSGDDDDDVFEPVVQSSVLLKNISDSTLQYEQFSNSSSAYSSPNSSLPSQSGLAFDNAISENLSSSPWADKKNIERLRNCFVTGDWGKEEEEKRIIREIEEKRKEKLKINQKNKSKDRKKNDDGKSEENFTDKNKESDSDEKIENKNKKGKNKQINKVKEEDDDGDDDETKYQK
jgi:hypothetical protein